MGCRGVLSCLACEATDRHCLLCCRQSITTHHSLSAQDATGAIQTAAGTADQAVGGAAGVLAGAASAANNLTLTVVGGTAQVRCTDGR